jgi:hypothetical protein
VKKKLSVIFSLILTLFLAIGLFAEAMCQLVCTTVCVPQLWQQAIQDSSYTDTLYEEIYGNWENLLLICGVQRPEEILSSILTREEVSKHAQDYFAQAYTGEVTLDTTKLKQDLQDALYSYAAENNVYKTEQAELDANVQELVDVCIGEYTNAVQLPLLPRLLSSVAGMQSKLRLLQWYIGGACIGLLVFVFFLQQRRRNVAYYGAIATVTNTVLLLGGYGFVAGKQFLQRLPIGASALRDLAIAYGQQILQQMCRLGLLFLAATALLLVVYFICAFITKRKGSPV